MSKMNVQTSQVFSPIAQNWDEFPDSISSANMYVLIKSPFDKPLDELAKDASIPILAFTGTLWQEIRYITHALPSSEYAIFLALRRIDPHRPHFLAFDFFMPSQTASGGGVSLDPEDCQRHFNNLKKHPWYAKNGVDRHICHLHSHAGMNVFWSSIDDTQQLSRDDLGFMDDYRFYCVVNTHDDIKCSLVLYSPVLARVDAATAISFSGQDHALQLTRERQKALDSLISASIHAPVMPKEPEKVTVPAFDYFPGWKVPQKTFADKKVVQSIVDLEPTDLAWFAFLDKGKCDVKVSQLAVKAFVDAANVSDKAYGRARHLVAWCKENIFGDAPAGEYDPEVFGELLGSYIAEFIRAIRMLARGPINQIQFDCLGDEVVEAISSGTRETIIKKMIEDLRDTADSMMFE